MRPLMCRADAAVASKPVRKFQLRVVPEMIPEYTSVKSARSPPKFPMSCFSEEEELQDIARSQNNATYLSILDRSDPNYVELAAKADHTYAELPDQPQGGKEKEANYLQIGTLQHKDGVYMTLEDIGVPLYLTIDQMSKMAGEEAGWHLATISCRRTHQ